MRNTNGSAFSGMRSSLKNSLVPSARVRVRMGRLVWTDPVCMPATILRSNQTMNMVPTRPITNTTTTFRPTTASGCHQNDSASRTGSAAGIRCKVFAAFAQFECDSLEQTTKSGTYISPLSRPGWPNAAHAVSRSRRSSGHTEFC